MILPNMRQQLTPDDHALVVEALGGGVPQRRADLRERAAGDGMDALLDDPDLLQRLCERPGCASPSARLFIYVAVRHALCTADIDDRPLTDYLAAVVFEFAQRHRAWRIAPHDDAEYHTLAEIAADVARSAGRRGFLLCAHLGNYSLWLTGIFPDHITARRERRGGPGFRYYETLGARGFRLASDDRRAREFAMDEVYARAADRFAELRVALNRLSDQAFFGGARAAGSPDRLLRQVADDARFPPRGPLF